MIHAPAEQYHRTHSGSDPDTGGKPMYRGYTQGFPAEAQRRENAPRQVMGHEVELPVLNLGVAAWSL